MTETTPFARTRGGLLVALVVGAVIGFELRTVFGMLLGVDLPVGPYVVAVLGVLAVFAMLADSLGKFPDRARRSE